MSKTFNHTDSQSVVVDPAKNARGYFGYNDYDSIVSKRFCKRLSGKCRRQYLKEELIKYLKNKDNDWLADFS